MVISEAEELASLDGMRVGPLTAGEIGPYSSVLLEIIWKPTIQGPVDTDFIVSFSDPLSQPVRDIFLYGFCVVCVCVRENK